MAGRTLRVDIIGDASSLERSLNHASNATSKLGNTMKLAGAAIAGGLAYGLTKSVEAALAAQKSQARLDQAFKNTGLSASAAAGRISEAESSARKLGFTDEETKNALGSLVTASGSVGKSMADLAVAQDVARFKGVGLSDATKMMTTAMAGSQRAAKQLGIIVPSVTTNYDALKATMGKTIDATEKLRLAHAKLLDKMATGQAVIDAVKNKVKGQAQVFSDTAAGGLAQFGAQFDRLKVGLGDVFLPVLGKVASGLGDFIGKINDANGASAKLSAAWDGLRSGATSAFNGLRDAFNSIDWPAVWAAIKQGFDRIPWAQIASEVGQKVMAMLQGLTKAVNNVDWAQVGQAIGAGIKRAIGYLAQVDWGKFLVAEMKWNYSVGKAIVTVTLSLVGVLAGALLDLLGRAANAAAAAAVNLGKRLIDGMWNGIQNAWTRVANWFTGLPGRIVGALGNVSRILYDIGVKIVTGLWDGLKSKWEDVKGWLSGLGGVIKSLKGPPAKDAVLLTDIGNLIMQGLHDGMMVKWEQIKTWLSGLSPQIGKSMGTVVDAAIAAIQSRQGALGTAFSNLLSQSLAAFDAASAQMQTATEKKIAGQDAAKANAGRQGDLYNAKWAVATATAGGDPAAIVAAQQQLADAEFAIQRAADEKKAAAERKALDDRRALQRVHFEEHLQKLQGNLDSQKITVSQFNTDLIGLFKANEVPFGKAAKGLGSALEYGLNKAFKGVDAAAAALASAIVDRLSRITVKVNVELQDPQAPGQKRALGGPVSGGVPYLVGEQGPEIFMPSGSGSIIPNNKLGGGGGSALGGNTNNFYFPNYVGNKADLQRTMQEIAAQFKRNNGTPLFA